MHLELT